MIDCFRVETNARQLFHSAVFAESQFEPSGFFYSVRREMRDFESHIDYFRHRTPEFVRTHVDRFDWRRISG